MKTIYMITALVLTLVGTATSVDYKVEGNIGKGQFKQLAIGANDMLYALNTGGDITIFNPAGEVTGTIRTGLQGVEALAIAEDGSIHLLSNITKSKKVKSGARMVNMNVTVGVQHTLLDSTGKQQKTAQLEGLKSVKTARFIDGMLVVADYSGRALVILNPETGRETGRIDKGLRLCCGIFDFCEAPNGTVAISNLGAFKVQQYTLTGEPVMEFGQRGRDLDAFQGCCNPVSTAFLPGGEILTIEKDPTRIKIYDSTGQNARQVEGVEELVKGCSFIPSAVDSKGTIYMASSTKNCIVKCVVK